MARKKETELVDNMLEAEQAPLEATEELTPIPGDKAWEPYVLSHLSPDEIFEGRPKTAGLRRVFTKLFGTPIFTGPINTQVWPDRTTVTHEIRYGYAGIGDSNSVVTVVDNADATDLNNQEDPFNLFHTAVATTRAEGRALKKALLLSTLVAEEAPRLTEASLLQTAEISSAQTTLINQHCRRLDIDVMKFVNGGKEKYESIEKVPNGKATEILSILTDYKRGEKTIPDRFRGYKESWQANS